MVSVAVTELTLSVYPLAAAIGSNAGIADKASEAQALMLFVPAGGVPVGGVESPAVIIILSVAVQLAASVMVTVIVPGPAPVKLKTVVGGPFINVEAPVVLESTLKVYGGVPPFAVKLPEPSLVAQDGLVLDGVFSNSKGKIKVSEYGYKLVFPFESVTFKVGVYGGLDWSYKTIGLDAVPPW